MLFTELFQQKRFYLHPPPQKKKSPQVLPAVSTPVLRHRLYPVHRGAVVPSRFSTAGGFPRDADAAVRRAPHVGVKPRAEIKKQIIAFDGGGGNNTLTSDVVAAKI